jgi:protein-S-isoprenylcysteine O-methyltransferase Ste14
MVLLAVPGFIALAMRKRNEEARLIERFGDEYLQYMHRTGMYLPRYNR